METEEKPSFHKRADYSMGLLDYERIDGLLKEMHELDVAVKNGEETKLMQLHSVIMEVYKCIRSEIMEKEKFDKRFRKLLLDILDWEKKREIKNKRIIPWKSIIIPLEDLQMDVLEHKHKLMGFTTTKRSSVEERLERGLDV